jgi:iron complex outermembrane receptor protein
VKHARMVSRLLAGSAIALVGGAAGLVHAQEAEGQFTLDEVVVTAQKRAQNIQDVPIAVTALGGDALVANRIASPENLTGLAPGLIARRNPGGMASPSFTIRGVAASASVPTQDRQIPIYLDGVYLGGNRGSFFDTSDLERVEVLRGPQGTLFGRNATAGAVQFITRNPTGEMAFLQEVTVGNLSQLRTRTTVDTPSFGPFSAYVTYVHDEKRGDVRNLGAGTTFDRTNPFNSFGRTSSPKWLGGKNYESVFGALRYDNGGKLTASYKFDWAKGTFSQEARTAVAIDPNNFVGGVLLGILARQPAGGGVYGPVFLQPNDRRPDAYNNAWTQEGYHRVHGHNLTVEYQISDNLKVKNIFAYRKIEVFGPSTISGLDGLEYTAAAKAFFNTPFIQVAPGVFRSFAQLLGKNGDLPVGSFFASYGGNSAGDFHQYSDELQINYENDWLTLTAGGMYYSSKAREGSLPGFVNNFSFSPVPSLLPLGNVYDDRGTVKSISAYSQAEIKFTEQLGAVLGARITKEKKTSQLFTGGTFVGDRTSGGSIVGANAIPAEPAVFKKTKPSFAAGLNYEPTDDMLVYGKFSTAFLSGGATGDITFAPETAKSWEAGIKSDWLGGKLRLNLTAYTVKYSNSQAALSGTSIGRFDLGVAVITLGDRKAKGVEFDFAAAPFDGFSVGGTIGYTDAKLLDPNPIFAQGRDVEATGISKWVGSANATYVTPPLFDEATMMFRVDATFQSKQRVFADKNIARTAPVYAPYEFMPSKTLVNARVALRNVELGRGNLEVAVWSKNLFNSRKPLYPFDFGGIMYTSSYEPARTYGVDLIFKFNP